MVWSLPCGSLLAIGSTVDLCNQIGCHYVKAWKDCQHSYKRSWASATPTLWEIDWNRMSLDFQLQVHNWIITSTKYWCKCVHSWTPLIKQHFSLATKLVLTTTYVTLVNFLRKDARLDSRAKQTHTWCSAIQLVWDFLRLIVETTTVTFECIHEWNCLHSSNEVTWRLYNCHTHNVTSLIKMCCDWTS